MIDANTATISQEKSTKPIKKGLREFDDLRVAVKAMESHNAGFYFTPKLDDFAPLDRITEEKISRLECKCGDYLRDRDNFLKSYKIRFCCKHIAAKLVNFPLHPLTQIILQNRFRHGTERFVYLSSAEPVILGFTSFVKLRWINVYHFDKKRNLAIRFSFNPFENKWSYGKLPPDGREVQSTILFLLRDSLMRRDCR